MACTAIPSDFSRDLNNLHRSDSADGLIDRLEAASCALIDRPLKQIAPYKALKSFDFGSSRKPPPDVARRLKAEDLGFVTVEVPSNHNSSTKKFSCLRFDQSHITARLRRL